MEYRILGPLEIRESATVIAVGGVKQQTLLAFLCLHANRHVSVTGLIDALWGGAPPPSSRKNVQLYVSRLRRLLATGRAVSRLTTVGDGYVLSTPPETVDLARCQVLWERGRESMRRGDPEQAARRFREAVELWRGRPLSGLDQTPVMRAEAARLEQLRLALLGDYHQAQLDVGRYAEAIPDLVRLVRLHPHEERLRGHLMLALWRSGQRPKALATYLEAYHAMVDDLGIEPTQRLRVLHRAILADGAEPAASGPRA
ncbi:hypothetical protein GCM10027168_09650 [Streptomyces capparidis]